MIDKLPIEYPTIDETLLSALSDEQLSHLRKTTQIQDDIVKAEINRRFLVIQKEKEEFFLSVENFMKINDRTDLYFIPPFIHEFPPFFGLIHTWRLYSIAKRPSERAVVTVEQHYYNAEDANKEDLLSTYDSFDLSSRIIPLDFIREVKKEFEKTAVEFYKRKEKKL